MANGSCKAQDSHVLTGCSADRPRFTAPTSPAPVGGNLQFASLTGLLATGPACEQRAWRGESRVSSPPPSTVPARQRQQAASHQAWDEPSSVASHGRRSRQQPSRFWAPLPTLLDEPGEKRQRRLRLWAASFPRCAPTPPPSLARDDFGADRCQHSGAADAKPHAGKQDKHAGGRRSLRSGESDPAARVPWHCTRVARQLLLLCSDALPLREGRDCATRRP